jgi:hypothetical protein
VKVVTVVIVKGRLVSDFCSPAFTWAKTVADARAINNAAVTDFIFIVVFLSF